MTAVQDAAGAEAEQSLFELKKQMASRLTGQAMVAEWVERHFVRSLMHVHGLGWFYNLGERWVSDDIGFRRRAVLVELQWLLGFAFETGGDPGKAMRADVIKCMSANGVEGILTLAGSSGNLAARVSDLDMNPYLLNTPNGTLDLRTMVLREHDRADRITKMTEALYLPVSGRTAWDDFIESVLPDAEVRGFVQRLIGLSLLGKVREHILALFIGTGANGKSTFLKAITYALGDYAGTAEPEIFMARDGQHPTGIMDLRGLRLAVVSESERDRHLAEASVKRLTGGDTIKARKMRQDFVEFEPSHTAIMVTNHLPGWPVTTRRCGAGCASCPSRECSRPTSRTRAWTPSCAARPRRRPSLPGLSRVIASTATTV